MRTSSGLRFVFFALAAAEAFAGGSVAPAPDYALPGATRTFAITYTADVAAVPVAARRLRIWLPHAASVLMDRDTLLEHRERWVTEPTPTNAALPRLTAAEQSVYEDLVTDRFGHAVRLEQERIDWKWALERLARLT